ncbi:prion-inhibition and propagation-domain-containing protein [Phaeosphaeria sp. MPI-PUGE-AT-0046c]|nr:prion-inhibition and propagation-domain-containing protein [Phaeosphaeria sp. MPI-PUGE-AT-0046c]
MHRYVGHAALCHHILVRGNHPILSYMAARSPQYCTSPRKKIFISVSVSALSSQVMEAVGLGIGLVGLVGLFSACIDCFELVERGRYHGRDYLLLETKFTNQRLRLRTWGQACGFTHERAHDADDICGDEEVRASLEATLAHLLALLRDGQALTTKYGLKRDQTSQGLFSVGPVKIGALVPNRLMSGRVGQRLQELGESVYRTQKQSKITTKAKWAITDKAKFSELVQHLKDLIDDLEGLTRWLAVPERQRKIIQLEVESISDIDTLETMEEARVGRLDIVSDAASIRLWELRDRYLEDVTGRSPPIAQRLFHASNGPSDDGWHDISRDAWSPPDHNTDGCYRVFHKVNCPHVPDAVYLDAPSYSTRTHNDHQWIVLDSERPAANFRALHLCGRRPVLDLEAFQAQNRRISFVILKKYDCQHDGSQGEGQAPDTSGQSIYLWSSDLHKALTDVLSETLPAIQLERFKLRSELQAPYPWFYRSRRQLGIARDESSISTTTKHDVGTLFEAISTAMADEYAAVDALISEGCMTWEFLSYIFAPGDIVLKTYNKGRAHHQAYELTSLEFKEDVNNASSYLVLHLLSCEFCVTLEKVKSSCRFTRSQFVRPGRDRFAIEGMPLLPLEHAGNNMRAFLAGRGQTLLQYVHRRLVNYTGWVSGSMKPVKDRKFMIDNTVYYELHPERSHDNSTREQRRVVNNMLHKDVDEMSLLLLPPKIYGFDMQEHQWKELLVVWTSPVSWKTELFEQLILPENDKELLEAMAISSLTYGTTRYHEEVKGLGRYLLLHGGPGSGKTFAAEAVAELVKRPLFQISFSSMGTDSKTAQQYLQKIASLCNRWECVVLLAGADVFFEKRSFESLERNAMVLAIIEALDSFTGMIILTSDRATVLDPSIRSRCQLAIGLRVTSRADREKIWFHVLQDGDPDCDDHYLTLSIEHFAGWKLNGLQIKNVFSMATEIARAKEETLSKRHIEMAYDNSHKFAEYFTRLDEENISRKKAIPITNTTVEKTHETGQE